MIMINDFKIGDKLQFANLFCAFVRSKEFVYSRHTKLFNLPYISSDYVVADLDGCFLVLNFDGIYKNE
jgi:hypothetical protein